MGKAEKLAAEVGRSLEEALPKLRKTIRKKLPLAVAAMLEGQTPNTLELSTFLPLETARADMREQWLRRLLRKALVDSGEILEPFAGQVLEDASSGGQTILLSMDQTDLGRRFAILMLSVRCGERALPLAWKIESGDANIGFSGQQELLDRVRSWLPESAAVILLADRFYPSAALFAWILAAGWRYRLRLRGNLVVDVGGAGGARPVTWRQAGANVTNPRHGCSRKAFPRRSASGTRGAPRALDHRHGRRGPVPVQWTPRGEERYPRSAGSVACDEPETGRRWITRRYSLQGSSSRAGWQRGTLPAPLKGRRRQVAQG